MLYLGEKGGTSIGECVRRVMSTVMKSGLGQRFNMNGAQRHGKTGFKSTKMFDIVFSKCPLKHFTFVTRFFPNFRLFW